jgi:flavodoxin
MKALVLFRSYHGNTKQVAEAIAGELRAMGHETTVQDLRQKLPELNGIDLAMIGSPTRMARVNRKALAVLNRLGRKGFAGKPIAVFDTYGPAPTNPEELEKARRWLYPGAAGIMHQAAKDRGLKVYEPVLRCEVKGLHGPLADNELAKAVAFTREFVRWISSEK